jgi:hypothetical protein
MDEQDVWSIWLVKLCIVIQKAIRKQICITCTTQTSLGAMATDRRATIGFRRATIGFRSLVILRNEAQMS